MRSQRILRISQIVAISAAGGIGFWAYLETEESLLALPLPSVGAGFLLGILLAGAAYSKTLERLTEAAPLIFLMVIFGATIMYLFTVPFLAGFGLSMTVGLLISVISGELIGRTSPS